MISARAESLMVTEMVASLRRVGRVEYEGSVQVPLFLLRTARQMAGRRVSCRVHLRLSQQSFGGISRNEAYASDQNATQLPRLNEVVGFRPSDSVDCAELAERNARFSFDRIQTIERFWAVIGLPLRFRIARPCTYPFAASHDENSRDFVLKRRVCWRRLADGMMPIKSAVRLSARRVCHCQQMAFDVKERFCGGLPT
jgi:hypothetical protein